jgi:hypothetical protein
MEQDNSAFSQSEELDQERNENFRHDNDLQEPPSLTEGGFSSVNTNYENIPLEENAVKKGRPPIPKHYFDVFTGSVIDRKFYKYFERSGVNPENVRDLSVLLRETQVPLRPLSYRKLDSSKTAKEMLEDINYLPTEPEKYAPSYTRWKWDKERYIQYGHWLYSAVAPPRDNEYRLNVKVIKQAAHLGLGAGIRPINNKFKKRTKFYEHINAIESRPLGAFDDWSTEKFIKHIQKIGKLTGKTPTHAILLEYAKINPFKNPSPDIIGRRIDGKGELVPAIEMAGYIDSRNWDEDDFYNWGVKVITANNGLDLNAYIINYLSSKRLGPNTSTISLKFGLNNFKQRVRKDFEERKANENEARDRKLVEIEQLIRSENHLEELFESAESEVDLIKIYAKYQVVHSLCPEWEESTKIIVSTRGSQDASFIGSIRKLNNSISAGDIESAALYLDVFDDIWPMDGYEETLKLDDGFEEFRELQRQRDRASKIKKRERKEQSRKTGKIPYQLN